MTHVVIIGAADVGRRACNLLIDAGVSTVHIHEPSDDELRHALASEVSGIAVLLHDDIRALRYCLAIEQLRPGVRLFVAMFDQTARDQLRAAVPNCVALSPAAIAVPSMVAAAVAPNNLAVSRRGERAVPPWITVEALKNTRTGPRGLGYAPTRLPAAFESRARSASPEDSSAPTTRDPACLSVAPSGCLRSP